MSGLVFARDLKPFVTGEDFMRWRINQLTGKHTPAPLALNLRAEIHRALKLSADVREGETK